MSKQDYLEMYKFHFLMIQEFENDVFNLLNDEMVERNNRNKASLEHARNILKRYYKTFDEEMIDFAKN